MLRDVRPLHEWAERDDPPISVWRAVSAWVERLGDVTWQAPSVPVPELSNQPEYEFRGGEVPGSAGVRVYYRHFYAEDAVDLIGVVSGGAPPTE